MTLNIAFVLLLSPAILQGYIDDFSSRLGISPPPTLVVTAEPVTNGKRAWITQGRPDVITVRKWVVDFIDPYYGLYMTAHEVCHIYLKHHDKTQYSKKDMPMMQLEADHCARKFFDGETWWSITVKRYSMRKVTARKLEEATQIGYPRL